MTDLQIWILLGGIFVIGWGVILVNAKLNDLLDHLYRFKSVRDQDGRLAKAYGSLTDNQEIISEQLDLLNHQIHELRNSDQIPKHLRQIRDVVRGGIPEGYPESDK